MLTQDQTKSSAQQAPSAAPAPRKKSLLVRILLGGLAVVAAVVALFLIVVAMQPADFRIVRSAKMSAPPPAVFEQVNDFRNWQAWSPWAKLDPNAKYTFEGPSSGEGAIFRWAGNAEIGEGSMSIVESQPSERIRLKLEFIKPFADTADTEFTFQPEGEQTLVTWSMAGKNNFMAKAVCLFMDMDKMLGGQFEEGLANMKKVVESKKN
jgi:hypothetical protein